MGGQATKVIYTFCGFVSYLFLFLSYNTSGLEELALNWAFLAKIWVPDTFFVNGKKSFLHKITVPNRFAFSIKLPMMTVSC